MSTTLSSSTDPEAVTSSSSSSSSFSSPLIPTLSPTPRIHAIDKQSIHRICSGQVITSLSIAIKELVENAIDAQATTIDIRLREYGTENFEVYDNGIGITPDNYEGLTAKYHTSKIASFEDIFSVPTFGFRGEAVSSLCEVAGSFTVITRTNQDNVGTKLEYDHSGKLLRTVPIARTIGTTITVQDLFKPLPVRYREFLKSARKQYGKALLYLQAYALILTKVRILVSHVVTGSLNSSLSQLTGSSSTFASSSSFNKTVTSGSNRSKKTTTTSWTGTGNTNDENTLNDDDNGNNVSQLSVGRHTVLATSGSGTLKDNIIEVFGAKFFSTLEPFHSEYRTTVMNSNDNDALSETGTEINTNLDNETEEGSSEREEDSTAYNATPLKLSPKILRQKLTQISIHGYVSKAGTGIGRSNNDRQFLYINNRPVEIPKVTKIINDVWRTYEMNHKPAYVLNFLLPSGIYDINVTPDKREVFLAGEQLIMDHLKSRLHLLWESSRRTFTIAPTLPSNTLEHLQIFDGTKESTSAKKEKTEVSFQTDEALVTSLVDPSTNTNNDIRLPYRMKSPPSAAEYMESYNSSNTNTVTGLLSSLVSEHSDENVTTTVDTYVPISPQKSIHSLSSPKSSSKRMVGNDGNLMLRPEMKRYRHGEEDDGEDTGVLENTVPQTVDESVAMDDNPVFINPPTIPSHVHKEYVDPVEVQLRKIYLDDTNHEKGNNDNNNNPENECKLASQREPIDLQQIRAIYSQRKDHHIKIKQRIMEVTERSPSHEPKFIPFFDRYMNHDELFEQETLRELKIPYRNPENRKTNKDDEDILDVGTIGVSSSEDASSSETMEQNFTRVLNKAQFRIMANQIIGQFNLGFIIARTGNDIYILDQHACDEKYQYETLKATTRIHEQRLLVPRKIDLTAAEELIILDNMEIFNANGFHFVVDEQATTGSRIKVAAIPFSKNIQFGDEDIQELTSLLAEGVRTTMTTTMVDSFTNEIKTLTNMVRLPKANAMFASRACRSAIMIGTALKQETMHRVVSQLSKLEHPWSCPHGRPTLRHLLDTSSSLIANTGKLCEAGTDTLLRL